MGRPVTTPRFCMAISLRCDRTLWVTRHSNREAAIRRLMGTVYPLLVFVLPRLARRRKLQRHAFWALNIAHGALQGAVSVAEFLLPTVSGTGATASLFGATMAPASRLQQKKTTDQKAHSHVLGV